MAESLKQQFSEIKKDVEKISRHFTKELSKGVVNDLTNVFINIVDDFYSRYEPNRYVRTHNLYNALLPYTPLEKSNGYISGITVGSFYMFDNYKISPDNVFDLFWNKGVRGLPKVGTRLIDTADGDAYHWQNPTWMSHDGECENVFKTRAHLGKYTSVLGTPHQVMEDIVNHWGEAIGQQRCDEVYKKIKSD